MIGRENSLGHSTKYWKWSFFSVCQVSDFQSLSFCIYVLNASVRFVRYLKLGLGSWEFKYFILYAVRFASAPLYSQKIRELVYDVLRITLHTAELSWLPLPCPKVKKRGNATIVYRTAFPVGDCVLVHPSSLLDSWAAILAKWGWRSNIRWEADKTFFRLFHHPSPCRVFAVNKTQSG